MEMSMLKGRGWVSFRGLQEARPGMWIRFLALQDWLHAA